ncbi:MAG: FG-GAP repeat protein, partial [Phycisphaerales bacterium]
MARLTFCKKCDGCGSHCTAMRPVCKWLAIVMLLAALSTGAGADECWLVKVRGSSATQLAGSSVAITGSSLFVGAPEGYTNEGLTGKVHLFRKTLQGYSRTELAASDRQNGSGADFGHALALSGDTLVVGAPYDDHSGFTDAGSVYVFEYHDLADEW